MLGARRSGRRCSSLASPRVRARLEEEALRALKPVLEPPLTRCVQLAVQPDAKVALKLEFGSGVRSHRDAVERAVTAALESLSWARGSIMRSTIARPRSFMGDKAPPSLRHVGALIGVSSCKGGVGKSTVAVNLAFALSSLGARVGLLDADVHGPSLPILVGLPEGALPLKQDPRTKLIAPADRDSVRLMSYGFVAKGASAGHVPAAVMRGPMVAKTVGQMLSGTDWGELDFLLIDLPPGTGDVHLTLSQTYGFTAAIVVTTPQRLSRADVLKGIDMFNELKVPIVTLIENMAFFRDDAGREHFPFGKSQLDSIRVHAGLHPSDVFRVPIEAAVSAACDESIPVVLLESDSESKHAFLSAADHLAKVLATRQIATRSMSNASRLFYDPTRGLVLRFWSGPHEGREFILDQKRLSMLKGSDADSAVLLANVEECTTDAQEAGARLRWCDGQEKVVTYHEIVRWGGDTN